VTDNALSPSGRQDENAAQHSAVPATTESVVNDDTVGQAAGNPVANDQFTDDQLANEELADEVLSGT
jgi:hypothetical protein